MNKFTDKKESSNNYKSALIECEKSSISILIVDDERMNLLTTKRMLEQNGYTSVRTCGSGEEAIEIVKKEDFDIVLLDIQMGGINGYETCSAIKAEKPDIYAIMLTGTVTNESIKESYNAGAMDFVRKQFDNIELIVRVENAVKIMNTEKALKKSFEDIAEKNKRLQNMLITDNMTNVFTRNHIINHISNFMYSRERYGINSPLTVMMLDIDKFKLINDNFGHIAGDEAIIMLAEILKSSVRQSDLVGRYGGDEFIIMLPNTDIQGALQKAEIIRNRVYKRKFNMAPGLDVTVSIGVCKLQDETDPDDLITRADHMLYKAKENGRNRVES